MSNLRTNNLFRLGLGALMALFLFLSFCVQAQVPPGITISWDKEVGCQIYGFERDKSGNGVFTENIELSDCLRVCENSEVTYTLSNVPANATVTWDIVGGSTTNNTSNTCTIDWGIAGNGSLSYTVIDGSNVISKTICIEKIITPIAKFDIAPVGQTPVAACAEQLIHFVNLSSANNGTSLVSYVWDFGDGNTSTAFEPSHSYANTGIYHVSLIVKNECNCTDEYKMEIKVEGKGLEISCPTVVCENQTAVYSIPEDIAENCDGMNSWSVEGGHIISSDNQSATVVWDDVDESGFGYVTYDPSNCNTDCHLPISVKVPVVQTNGTIQGISSICLGGQGRYKLPQWPTTEIQWEIIGNVGNNIAQIIQTDQRNEIIIEPYVTGTFTLRALYKNTLLNCGGQTEFVFHVEEPIEVSGEPIICENSLENYTNSTGNPSNWTLTTNNGTVVTTQNNVVDFSYTFTQAGNYLLSVEQAGYCDGEQFPITVLETPTAPLSVDGEVLVCANNIYNYSIPAPEPNSTYFWSVNPLYGSIIGADEGTHVNIQFNGTHSCSPYFITIQAVPNPNTPNVVYNWSNGMSGQSINLLDGGPYSVTASVGSCSITKEIYIPRHPDYYMWIYPSGCYTSCVGEGHNSIRYLVGPTLSLPYWSWNNYGVSQIDGTYSYQSEYYLYNDGDFTSTINTGYCEKDSAPLAFERIKCEECDIRDIKLISIIPQDSANCSFEVTVEIETGTSMDITISEVNNNAMINPPVINTQGGVPLTVSFNIYPISPFNGGMTYWVFEGVYIDDSGQEIRCIYYLEFPIPPCNGGEDEGGYEYTSKQTSLTNKIDDLLEIYPNPAKDVAVVSYDLSSNHASLEVFDMTGRSLSKYSLEHAKGEFLLQTNQYASGIYLIVIRQDNGFILQKKLVIE